MTVDEIPELNTTYGATLRIPYTSRDFPGGTIAGSGHLQTEWDDLLGAALTVGRPNTAYVFAHGDPSYYEALFRLSLVRMALEQRSFSGALYRTDAFRSLDPTEKGAVSYFLGMTICKLFASRFLHTPWLLHLDVFRGQLDPVMLRGRSRPDLVGQDDTCAWHAFECKGRSSLPNAEDRRKAKRQAQRLVRVDSTDCSLHVGAVSYFRRDELEFHWRDPDTEDPETLEPIKVTLPEDAWRYYYAPALALATAKPKDARTAADVKLEVHDTILDLLLAGDWAAARRRAGELGPALQERGFRADGLKVVAGESWRRKPRRTRGRSMMPTGCPAVAALGRRWRPVAPPGPRSSRRAGGRPPSLCSADSSRVASLRQVIDLRRNR